MYKTPHKITKEIRTHEEMTAMLFQLRDEIYEKVKGTPITGPNDILLRINACLFSPKERKILT